MAEPDERTAPTGWQRHGRRTLLRTPRLQVWSDTVTHPGGGELDYVHVGTADLVRVVVLLDDQVYLIEQEHYLPGARLLQCPGGAVDTGETPLQAARREVREETGMEAIHLLPLGSMWPMPGLTGAKSHQFLATGVTAAASTASADRDASEADLRALAVPAKTVPALIGSGRLACAPSAAGVLLGLQRRSAGRARWLPRSRPSARPIRRVRTLNVADMGAGLTWTPRNRAEEAAAWELATAIALALDRYPTSLVGHFRALATLSESVLAIVRGHGRNLATGTGLSLARIGLALYTELRQPLTLMPYFEHHRTRCPSGINDVAWERAWDRGHEARQAVERAWSYARELITHGDCDVAPTDARE